jgi:hypothetical protein
MLAGKQAVMALISPGRSVTGDGGCSHASVQHAAEELTPAALAFLVPTARCNRCLRPSPAMHYVTSRPLWPLAGDASKRVRELPAGVPRVRVTAVTMKCGLSRPPR